MREMALGGRTTMSDPGAKPGQFVQPLVEGQVVNCTLFSEPMRVETIRESGPGT